MDKPYVLTSRDLERLERLVNWSINSLRVYASAEHKQPQAQVEKWTRGRCIREVIENGWLGT